MQLSAALRSSLVRPAARQQRHGRRHPALPAVHHHERLHSPVACCVTCSNARSNGLGGRVAQVAAAPAASKLIPADLWCGLQAEHQCAHCGTAVDGTQYSSAQ